MPREARDPGALWADRQEDPLRCEIRRAVYVQRGVHEAGRLEENVVFGVDVGRDELLVQRRLRVIEELRVTVSILCCRTRAQSLTRTSSAPRPRTYCSFFADALAATRAPFAFAIWMANDPTAVLPPLMNTDWPALSFANSSSAWYAARPAMGKPAASVGVTF